MTHRLPYAIGAALMACSLVLLTLADHTYGQDKETTVLPQGEVGPAGLDLNPVPGDQRQRQTFRVPEVGEAIEVDVIVTDGVSERRGFEAVLSFDPDELAFVAATPTSLFEGVTPAVLRGDSTVTIAGVRLDGPTSGNSGSLASLRFTVRGGFTGEARVTLQSVLVGTPYVVDTLSVGDGARYIVIGGVLPDTGPLSPDFNRDGSVGFDDFIAFASVFGISSSHQSFNPIYDLDESGDIGFGDFIQFAQAFGN